MNEDTQCETMGLQATSPPTSPLHRVPPAYHHAGLKRKHDNLEEDDLMPTNPVESRPEESKKIRVDIVCGNQTTNQVSSTHSSNSDNLIDQESRLAPVNNNAKEFETDKTSTHGEENKENQQQSSVPTFSARKSSPTPSFVVEGNIEKESNITIFASKSLSPKSNSISKCENTKVIDNDDSGIKTDNTDDDEDDEESEEDVGGATSEDDEYEEDGSEEGSEGFSSSLSPSPPHTNSAETNLVSDLSQHQMAQQNHQFTSLTHSQTAVTSLNPKVIVEHQPLPSIYDLQQMSAACDNLDSECNFDSGLSEDDSCCGDSEDEAEGDSDSSGEDMNLIMSSNQTSVPNSPVVSPLFDPVLRGTSTNKQGIPQLITPSPPTPKVIYNDRFWNQGLPFNHTPPPPSSSSLNSQHPVPQSQQPMSVMNSTFQFLEPTNQRIECAENGKSYMQLGTMSHLHSGNTTVVTNSQTNPSHHHLPVTPVIQPKPNMVYRRPIPPFRNPVTGHAPLGPHQNNLSSSAAMMQLQTARSVCDHTNCLQRKSSFCYRNQRSRMLNMSLHKLHLARQNHEGCLRRSVLICNMLRFIEDETEKEAIQEAHHQFPGIPNTSPPHMMDTDQYWPPPQPSTPPPSGIQHQQLSNLNGVGMPSQQPQMLPNMTPQGLPMPPANSIPANDGTASYGIVSPPALTSGVSSYHNVPNSALPSTMATGNSNATQQQQQPLLGHQGGAISNQPITDSYEVTLKDFNTAFRSTPYSSPVHHSGALSDIESSVSTNESIGLPSTVSQTLSSAALSSSGSTSLDDGRGSSSGTINWGSVLSLGSQSELDPLNNNSFAVETWPTTTVCGGISASSSVSSTATATSATNVLTSTSSGSNCSNISIQNGISVSQSSPPVQSTQNTLTSLPPLNLSDLDITSQSFVDDIGWKLSADDVLKAFPSDDQIFVGP